MKKEKLLILIVALVLIYLILRGKKDNSKHSSHTGTNKGNFISHTKEPIVGQEVQNKNPNCKHYNSKGTVVNITELPNNWGKLVTYQVNNYGNTYKSGDRLTKTFDQIHPCL